MEIQKNIVFGVICLSFLIWAYHRHRYYNSNFQRFSYYLEGKVNLLTYFVVVTVEVVIVVTIFLTIAYLIGYGVNTVIKLIT